MVDVNNAITGLNNNALRKVNVKPNGYDKINMDKDLVENKLYQLIDQFHGRKKTHKYHNHSKLLDQINPFSDGNGRTCKILFYLWLGLWLFKKMMVVSTHFSSFS